MLTPAHCAGKLAALNRRDKQIHRSETGAGQRSSGYPVSRLLVTDRPLSASSVWPEAKPVIISVGLEISRPLVSLQFPRCRGSAAVTRFLRRGFERGPNRERGNDNTEYPSRRLTTENRPTRSLFNDEIRPTREFYSVDDASRVSQTTSAFIALFSSSVVCK